LNFSVGPSLVKTNKTEDIPYTLDKNLNSSGFKLANDRLMLIDWDKYNEQSILPSNVLHYSTLEHADGNE